MPKNDLLRKYIQEGEATISGITARNMRVLAAGEDALFGDVEPDDSKAYVTFEICRALPNVAGPEMHGRYFGYHPQVLANSYEGLLHQQTNIGHQIKSYGTATNDRINGCIVGVAFPKAPIGGWGMPETVEAAPFMTVMAVMFKQAQGVNRLIGDHQTNRKKQSVSIEATYENLKMGIYDPGDASITPILDFMDSEIGDIVKYDKKKGLQIGSHDGRQFAFAPGGINGTVNFEGVGYTPTPAEEVARITRIAASSMAEETGFENYETSRVDVPKHYIGQRVGWQPVFAAAASHGEVCGVIMDGEISSSGYTFQASPGDPVLKIKLPDSRVIYRHSDSVKLLK